MDFDRNFSAASLGFDNPGQSDEAAQFCYSRISSA